MIAILRQNGLCKARTHAICKSRAPQFQPEFLS